MRMQLGATAIALTLLLWNSASFSQAIDMTSTADIPSPKLSRAADPTGRVQRFADEAGREFAVTYDTNGHPAAIAGAARKTAADVAFSSLPDGRPTHVRMANGYELYLTYSKDGTQVIRDRFGASLQRAPLQGGGYKAQPGADSTELLLNAVQRVDGLLSWIRMRR